MKHLYTLRKAMSGGHGSALNGKIFWVHKEPNGTVQFLNAQEDGKVMWETTAITNLGYTETGVVITTENTVYDLIDLSFIIPTTMKVTPDENLEFEESNEPTLISEEPGPTKMINYGDGYNISYLTFNRQMRENEIRAWLAEKGRVYRCEKDAAWYEDYVDLHPMNSTKTKWEMKRVRRYTD